MNTGKDKPILPYGWVVKQSSSYPDRVYYFNTNTGASTWDMPDLIKPYLDPHYKKIESDHHSSIRPPAVKSPPSGIPHRDESQLPPSNKGRPVTTSVEARFSPEPQFSPEVDSDESRTPRYYDDNTDYLQLNYSAPIKTENRYLNNSNQYLTLNTGNKTNLITPHNTENKSLNTADFKIQAPNNSVAINKNFIQNSKCKQNDISAKVKGKTVISAPSNQKKEVTKPLSATCNSSTKSDQLKKKAKIKAEKVDSLNTSSDSIKRKCSNDSGTSSTILNSSKLSSPSKKKKLENKNTPTKKNNLAKLTSIKKTEKVNLKSSDIRKVVESDSPLCSLSDLHNDDAFLRDRIHSGESSVHSAKTIHLSDPEKIKSIQSWIDQCDLGDPLSDPFLDFPDKCSTTSTSDTKRTSPDSGSISVTYTADMDNRRVVIAIDKPSFRTDDSGYSASTTGTLPQESYFRKSMVDNNSSVNNSWKGVHAAPPPVRQNREIMDMEIDEVQHELNNVEDSQIEAMEVCEIAVKEVREYLKKCPDEAIGKLTESYSKDKDASHLPNVTENLLIVVDTNLWMENLGFMEDLRDQSITGYGFPKIIVPWVVMQELDALKNRKSVLNLSLATEKKARAPINYLYHCFEQKHPRILAQTGQQACEAKEMFRFQAENNDDRILQCCLQCKKNYSKSRTVLLTNDKHLITKATITGVEAYNKQNLLTGLQGKPTTKMKSIEKSSTASTNNNTLLLKEPLDKMVDETYCKIKVLMKTALSIVVEKEMKSAYDDMWLQIVVRKPPWSLNDVLECLRRHWLAVFGIIYKRSLKGIINKLFNIFSPLKETFVPRRENVENMLEDALVLLEECNRVANYGLQFKEAVRELKSLQPQLQKESGKATLEKSNHQTASASMATVGNRQENPSHTTQLDITQLQLVMQAKFDRIWQLIHNCCSTHQQYLESANRDKQHDHEAVTLITKLVTVIKDIRHYYSISLTYTPEEIQKKPVIVHDVFVLVNSFFLRMDLENEDPITLEHVQSLFGDPEKRTLLQTGLDQLDEMIKKLYRFVRLIPD